MQQKLLLIGLDGYEASIGDALMAEDRLENIRRLSDRSARFTLGHGVEKYSALTWEHLSVGHSPHTTGRWSPIHFDAQAYDVVQMPTELTPFFARLPVRSVVFDCPYFDLARAPSVRGLVGWGAHDAGVAVQSRPDELSAEIDERFGAFVGKESLYGFTWPSPSRTRWLGRNLVEAADQRAEIAHWLLANRFPDWELGLIVTGELHSAVEPLWHGRDPGHPLHSLPSAEPSARALTDVYLAVDRLVGKLVSAFPDVTVLAFAMHGMGGNDSDVAIMVLLPELLYPKRFGRPLVNPRPDWEASDIAMLGEDEAWDESIRQQLDHPRLRLSGLRDALRPARRPAISEERRARSLSVEWIPATQYRRYWPDMQAFALPAYYHGRVRLNLRGREAHGKVQPKDHGRVCAQLAQLLGECRNLDTGEPAVKSVELFVDRDPMSLNETEADLEVVWQGATTTLEHPELGRIGPFPHRRTGGHSGPHGIAYLSGPGIEPRDHSQRSSFDVVPTVFDLLGEPIPGDISGHSLLDDVG